MPKLGSSKVSIKIGQSKVLKVKNTKKKVKWSVGSGKKNVSYSQAMYAVIDAPFIDVLIWSNDYQVVSVSELLAIKGKELITGQKYYNAN